MKRVGLLILVPALCLLAACSSNKASPTATAVASATLQPEVTPSVTRPPASPTAAATGTASPPVDGTVDPLGFGSTDPFDIKSNPDPMSGIATLQDVRVGGHPEQGGWDRIVFEFKDTRPSGRIEYVDSESQCGSGAPVTGLPGSAILKVHFSSAQAHNEQGQLTIPAQTINGPGNSILKAVESCDFEGVVNWAIATSGKQRFKVTLLENPTRVVIDVKW